VFKIAITDTRPAQATKYIQIKDHTYLAEHLARIGIALEDVNFFTWQAFPNRSYGKFLVSEKEWIEIIGVPNNDNQKAKLIIEDSNNTKEFTNLDIVSTAVIMSPIYPTGVTGQDGSRILLIEVEHTASKYHKHNRVYKQYEKYSDLVDEFKNENPKLRIPQIFNQHVISDIPLIEYLAYIAASNFFTVFLPPGESLPKLTDSKFTFPSNIQLLYNKTFSLAKALNYKVVIKDDRDCEPMGIDGSPGGTLFGACKAKYYQSELKAITLSDNIYKSTINANTDTQNIKVVVPYALINHIAEDLESGSGDVEVNAFANDIEANAKTRLLRVIDVTYQGLVPGEITNDIQSITYYFQSNEYGLRTRLKSIPWEIPSSQAWLHNLVGTDKVYKGYLLTNMTNSGETGRYAATAIIFNMHDMLVEITAQVFDATGIFTELKTGMTVLLYREASNCRFHIVQSECPPSTPPPTTQGKCCVSMSIQNGPSRNYCIETTQLVCQKINGTWTSGQTCNGNPYCE
jgi:hypothetical protein